MTPMQLCFEVLAVSDIAISLGRVGSSIAVGDRLFLTDRDRNDIAAEIIAFSGQVAKVLAFAACDGLGPGCGAWFPLDSRNGVRPLQQRPEISVSHSWIGRTFNSLGVAIDGHPQPSSFSVPVPIRRSPPAAMTRARLGRPISLGIRAMDLFTTCREGQRLGLFAGSGVGKSTLIAMIASQATCDVVVIALVGERGREVREFIEDDLGASGIVRTILVVATSDDPPLLRRDAPYTAMAIAEYFRDQGQRVLLVMDSVTRLCMALREIGLSAGELPATRGYPSSVFTELPRLLERAGPGRECDGKSGAITGLFTVLVEGDDHNEPIADAIRGILDGHVTLDRKIAEAGRYPAIDILRSLSRTFSSCHVKEAEDLILRARRMLSLKAEVADLVRLGAYQNGSDKEVDAALAVVPRIELLLQQRKGDIAEPGTSFRALYEIMSSDEVQIIK
jgi:flagellum-specific ATP synthase